MDKINVKGFEKFNKIGKDIVDIAKLPKELREDLKVYYISHAEPVRDEVSGEVTYKAKTVGKVVDNVVNLDGMFSIVLYTKVEKTKDGIQHYFITQNDGGTTAKTPIGMFDSFLIPNNLQIVSDAIDKFYEI
jgi:hypothetical protein